MPSPKKVAFYTLGCKLNYSETSAIGRNFMQNGYEKVGFEEAADVYVINTCSVTDNADRKCRTVIRRALKKAPNARIAVVGCYAQLQPENIAAIPGVNVVLGTSEKFKVADYFEDEPSSSNEPEIDVTAIDEVDFYVDAYSFGDRTRSFLKVQDGCDYGCSFCTIPLARGKSRSMDVASILHKAQEVASTGVKEVVLTGVNIGDFGKAASGERNGNETFLDLIAALDKVDGIERFRISSIEPNLLTKDIIRFVANSQRFTPHFHIPLQSGSDKILGMMRRRYNRELYKERVAAIKNVMPHCCIGVDVIVGFPGETEKDFKDTYHFLNELDISYLHVFTYSERPGTLAAEMENPVPMDERARRSKMLRNLSIRKRRVFYEQHADEEREVLFEMENDNGFMHGFTDNYIKVKFPLDAELTARLVKVRLDKVDENGEMLVKDFHENYLIT